ncbi:serine/threonine protein kinase [Roseomonas hellenica]|uniref:Serine/threonine protein kinase n=1 Tax=Plastoroseomonas hellenica TaxID=2687306 RepID=A0ABS5F763_9PROT|nr:serine/threonine-protein kinase [Plastoroseomonas hellenica]MBR0668389.1 serine/threonine protein kinase [Plastoroseomonas hellenica]
MADALPSRIGRYVVRSALGRGAMGEVYLAHDPEIDRPVAVKLVAAALLEGEGAEEHLQRFRAEARASGRCNHPNIVAVYDVGLHEGRPFLAMEYVAGRDLANLLAEGRRFTPTEAAKLLGQLLDALGSIHAAGIVHRDLKPANLLLHGELQLKLADFGIARMDGTGLTQTGALIGTPAYMSPEQCRGETVDARTDLFTAGALLHEMLTGERAFGKGALLAVMRRILEDPPPPLPAAILSVAPGLGMVRDRALAKRPEQRFASAGEMAAALRQAGSGAATSPGDDTTIIAATPAATEAIDPGMLESIERSLASYVGPIAGTLVRSATRHAVKPETLAGRLAESIADVGERRRFLEDVRRLVPAKAAPAAPVTMRPDKVELERLVAALAAHIGPLARVLVARAVEDGGSGEALWERVAQHIDDAAERAQFLRRRKD